MSLIVHSAVSLLELELAKARTTLEEIPPHGFLAPTNLREMSTPGSMATCREFLSSHVSDFSYGQKRLTAYDLGLVSSVKASSVDLETATVKHDEDTTQPTYHPLSLVDVLSNSLVAGHLAPYLTPASLLSLASTSHAIHSLVLHTPYVNRHMDLTNCRSALVREIAPIDNGGQTWRSERMDEALTEDEFYGGPLRGIFSKMQLRSILSSVRTLVLDGLSVPADLVSEIILTDRFNINILSIRDCIHLNERKLMQVLQYAVRPERPQGTPRVKGIYYFTSTKSNSNKQSASRREWWRSRVSSASGSLPSPESSSRPQSPTNSEACTNAITASRDNPCCNEWYRPFGKVFHHTFEDGWARTIQKCEGIIAFDAVLCRGPRHNVDLYSSPNPTGDPRPAAGLMGPAIATIALGPRGCEGCYTSPEGPAVWGQSPYSYFPLLLPLPLHSSMISDAKRPFGLGNSSPAIMIARCGDCMTNRWCHRCHKWFCYKCMPQPTDGRDVPASPHQTTVRAADRKQSLQQKQGDDKLRLGVSRDCFECGPTCAACKMECQRICQRCRGEYCIKHNEGCSITKVRNFHSHTRNQKADSIRAVY
jgi:hypothetical protein